MIDAGLGISGRGTGRCHIGGGSITAQRLGAKRASRGARGRVDVLFRTRVSSSTSSDVACRSVRIRAGMPASGGVLCGLLFLGIWTCGGNCVRRLRAWRGRGRHDWSIECDRVGWRRLFGGSVSERCRLLRGACLVAARQALGERPMLQVRCQGEHSR